MTSIFGNEEISERVYTIEGLTNGLEGIKDTEVTSIKNELKNKCQDIAGISERDFNLDSRRIYLNCTTVNDVIKMYANRL